MARRPECEGWAVHSRLPIGGQRGRPVLLSMLRPLSIIRLRSNQLAVSRLLGYGGYAPAEKAWGLRGGLVAKTAARLDNCGT